MNRCTWATKHALETHYHDTEWGVENHDERYLFEMLNLEGQQAGLNWLTILSKRQSMRKAYANFDPAVLVTFTQADIESLMCNPGIIRHRLKIKAVVSNAHAYHALIADFASLDAFLWRYVDGKPIVNTVHDMSDVASSSALSLRISKDLKKYGFKFVGPTTIYAFMQAVGMVDDHANSCFRKDKR